MGVQRVCCPPLQSCWGGPLPTPMKEANGLNYDYVDSEDSAQTWRILRLIWVFAGLTCQFVGFVLSPLNHALLHSRGKTITVKILKFGTPQTIAIIVLKIEKFDVTLH